MSRPLDAGIGWALGATGWLGGIALQLQQPLLWTAGGYVLCGALAVLMGWWARRWSATKALAGALALVIAAASAGFGITGWRAGQRLAQSLPASLEGQDVLLTGKVASLPRESADGVRFVFEVEQATYLGRPVQLAARVSLGWYDGFAGTSNGAEARPRPQLRAGQRWQLMVRLRQPHGTLNPHGFDVELWLFERGIRASGSVRDGPANRLLTEDAGHAVERMRQRVRDAIARQVDDTAAAGVLAALAVGDQAAIDRGDWDLFRRTGVAHLVSISGLHVAMVAWLAGGVVGFGWRRSARLMLAVPAPLAARFGGVLAAAGYALLAGWGVPAQRTVCMLATLALLRSVGLRWPAALVLLLTAAVVAGFDPWALLQPGFWLSFVAVALLMGSQPVGRTTAAAGQIGVWARLKAALFAGVRTQAVATVGLAPLSMLFFQQVSLVGFIANLVAIPLVTLLITPLALAGMLWPLLWSLDAMLVQALSALLHLLSGWPQAVWTASVAPFWAAVSGVLGGLLLILPLPERLRLLGVPLLLPLLLPPPTTPAEGQFDLLAADVGQGTAVLLRTRQHVLLYDTGPRYSADTDAGQRVLLPLLRAVGATPIDLLVLSHRDSDHVGGAQSLLAQGEVRAISSSLEDSHPLRRLAKAPHRRCAAGQQWTWDGVRFTVLHPMPQDYSGSAKPNALSCVLRVQAGNGASALLTGDIEAPQELALVERLGADLHSQVLMVPHHGSRTSSSTVFLHAVAPQVALAQAGYRSRFGHPAAAVVDRYRAAGVRFERSDRCGAWLWHSDGGDACERQIDARYWHYHADTLSVPP